MIVTKYEGNKTFSVTQQMPETPKEDEVQIQVAYCGICGTDVHIFHGMMDKRVPNPQTIGHEMSGTISALGSAVEGYKIGDKVVVRPLDNRGELPSDKGISHICKNLKFIGIDSPGAMQQFWNVPSFTLHKLQETTDLKLAALIEPLAVACHDVRMAQLQEGETAVVLGGGSIGMLIAFVAKSVGAQVIISEVNPVRIEMAKKWGFKTVNPTQEDLKSVVESLTEGRLADVVFEVAGVQPALDIMTEIAGIRGRIAMVAIHGQPKQVNLFNFFWKELKLIGARVYEPEDYEKAIELVTKNQLPFEELITSVKPLSKIQEAFEENDLNPNGMKTLLDCQN